MDFMCTLECLVMQVKQLEKELKSRDDKLKEFHEKSSSSGGPNTATAIVHTSANTGKLRIEIVRNI